MSTKSTNVSGFETANKILEGRPLLLLFRDSPQDQQVTWNIDDLSIQISSTCDRRGIWIKVQVNFDRRGFRMNRGAEVLLFHEAYETPCQRVVLDKKWTCEFEPVTSGKYYLQLAEWTNSTRDK